MAYQFKVGDEGKTRGGERYRVLATDATKAGYPIVAEQSYGPDGNMRISYHSQTGKVLSANGGALDVCDLIPPMRTVKTTSFWAVFTKFGALRDASADEGAMRALASETDDIILYYGSREVEIENPDNA